MIKPAYLIPLALLANAAAAPVATVPKYALSAPAVRYMDQLVKSQYTSCPAMSDASLTKLASELTAEEREQIDKLVPASKGLSKERISIAPADIYLANMAMSVRWPQAINGVINRPEAFSSTFTSTIPLLEGQGYGARYVLGKIQYQTQASCTPGAPIIRQSQFGSKELELAIKLGNTTHLASLKNLQVRIDERQDGLFVDGITRISIDSLSTKLFKLGRIEMGVSMLHVYAPLIAQMQASTPTLTMKADASQEERIKQTQRWAYQGLALFEYNPTFSLDKLYIETKDKGLIIDGSVHLSGLEKADAEEPARLLKKLDGKLHITMTRATLMKLVYWQAEKVLKDPKDETFKGIQPAEAKKLADNWAKAQLDELVKQGLVRIKQNVLSAELTFSQGQLMLNGQVVPLSVFDTKPEVTGEDADQEEDETEAKPDLAAQDLETIDPKRLMILATLEQVCPALMPDEKAAFFKGLKLAVADLSQREGQGAIAYDALKGHPLIQKDLAANVQRMTRPGDSNEGLLVACKGVAEYVPRPAQ